MNQIKKMKYDKSITDSEQITQNTSDSQFYILKQLKSMRFLHTEEEKLEKAKQINSNIQYSINNPINFVINSKICKEINNLIDGGEKPYQKELLNIIGIIAECREIILLHYDERRFNRAFHNSGLVNKIEEIINKEVEMEENQSQENIQYSEFIINLIQTFFYLNNNTIFNDNNLKQCGKVIVYFISKVVDKLKQSYNRTQNEQDNNEQDINLIRNMRIGIRLLRSIEEVSENYYNRNYFENSLNLHEYIAPLIHLNCLEELKCPNHIAIQEIEIASEFTAAAFHILAWFAFEENIKEYLIEKHDVLTHIIPIIISFAEKFSQINNQYDQKQYDSSSQPILFQDFVPIICLQVVGGALNLLNIILIENYDLFSKIIHIPGLYQSLIYLTSFGRNIHTGENPDQYTLKIRKYSNECLSVAIEYEKLVDLQELIIQWGFIKILIEAIGLCGGNEEANIKYKFDVLINIRNLFNTLQEIQGESADKTSSSSLLHSAHEQIEEEGGMEEIESHLHQKEKQDNYSTHLYQIAKITSNLIIYTWVNKSNEQEQERIMREIAENQAIQQIEYAKIEQEDADE